MCSHCLTAAAFPPGKQVDYLLPPPRDTVEAWVCSAGLPGRRGCGCDLRKHLSVPCSIPSLGGGGCPQLSGTWGWGPLSRPLQLLCPFPQLEKEEKGFFRPNCPIGRVPGDSAPSPFLSLWVFLILIPLRPLEAWILSASLKLCPKGQSSNQRSPLDHAQRGSKARPPVPALHSHVAHRGTPLLKVTKLRLTM